MQYLIFTDHCVCVLGLNKSVIYTGVMLYTALVGFCFVSSILNIPFMISFFYQTHCVLNCTMITKISCHLMFTIAHSQLMVILYRSWQSKLSIMTTLGQISLTIWDDYHTIQTMVFRNMAKSRLKEGVWWVGWGVYALTCLKCNLMSLYKTLHALIYTGVY